MCVCDKLGLVCKYFLFRNDWFPAACGLSWKWLVFRVCPCMCFAMQCNERSTWPHLLPKNTRKGVIGCCGAYWHRLGDSCCSWYATEKSIQKSLFSITKYFADFVYTVKVIQGPHQSLLMQMATLRCPQRESYGDVGLLAEDSKTQIPSPWAPLNVLLLLHDGNPKNPSLGGSLMWLKWDFLPSDLA